MDIHALHMKLETHMHAVRQHSIRKLTEYTDHVVYGIIEIYTKQLKFQNHLHHDYKMCNDYSYSIATTIYYR